MVEAGDGDAADVVVVQRSVERQKTNRLIVSAVVEASLLYCTSLNPSL